MTEHLTRIGAPPQAPKRKPRTWMIWAPVAVVALGLAALAGGYVVAGGPGPIRELLGMDTAESPPGLSTEVQIECANIKHAYKVWSDGLTDLAKVPLVPPEIAKHELKGLSEDGNTLLDAVSGHNDQPAKHLAVAVADYNFQVSLVALELQLGGTFKDETYRNAAASFDAVGVAYKAFVAETCT